MREMMLRAQRDRYAIGYFEAWDTYSMEAVLETAEEENSPVIIGFGGMMLETEWLDHGGVALLGAIGSHYARRSQVPVALILNEAQSMGQIRQGIDAGFNTLMLDTSTWPWDDAVATVSEITEIAHRNNLTVEAELGCLPDATSEGIDDSAAFLTDPERAAEFVEITGIDCLAVSIGNVHLLTRHDAPINHAHLEAIHARVQVPLVIHGGTSFPAESIPHAIANGVAKFNVGTTLKKAYAEAAREAISKSTALSVHELMGSHKVTDWCEAGKKAMKERVRTLMRLYGSAGKALRHHPEARICPSPCEARADKGEAR